MQPLKTQGIVVRVSQAGENGKMLTVLSGDMGKITVWGRGLGSSKHPAKSAAAPFSYSEFVLNPKGDVYSLSSGSLVRSFYGLSQSVEKLSLANYFCALSEAVLFDAVYAPEVLKLLLNSLHYLEGDEKEFFDLWFMFEIKALSAAGFMPNMDECVVCGGEPSLRINIPDGGLVCEKCALGSTKISPEAYLLLKKYIETGLKASLENNEENKEVIREALDISGRFIREHIGKLKSREYLQNIVRM